MGGTPVNPGFEYKLADGSVVKAENIDEAFKNVAKMKEDTSAALREERQKREEMEGRLNQLQIEMQQRTAPPPQVNGFDRDKYFRLVGEDPLMAANYLDAARYGIPDPSQVPGYFQDAFQRVSKLEQDNLSAGFISSHPDFPGGNDNAMKLTQEVIRLNQAGHPVNSETLDLAYRNCVENEVITPIEPPQQQDEPNPSPSGGGAQTVDAEASRIESAVMSGQMSMADFEKYLRSKGALT